MLERLWVIMEAKYGLSIDRFQYFQYNFFLTFDLLGRLLSPARAQEHRKCTVHLVRVLLDMLERLWVIMEAKYGLSIDRFQYFQYNFFLTFDLLGRLLSPARVQQEHRKCTVHLVRVLLDMLERLWVIMEAKYGLSIDRFQYFQYNFFLTFDLLWKVVKPCLCAEAQEMYRSSC